MNEWIYYKGTECHKGLGQYAQMGGTKDIRNMRECSMYDAALYM